jgi:three-Cys-motif partner protein
MGGCWISSPEERTSRQVLRDGELYAAMSRRKSGKRDDQGHRFGGDWTTKKLEILRSYLSAYTKVLKNQPFKTAYIEAFAGTGYRTLTHTETDGGLFFPDLADEAPQKLLEGSARMALQVEPRFDRYIFVEKDPHRSRHLEELRSDFPQLGKDILIQTGEGNKVIQELCRKDWSRHRAVLFLDPYGMQVEWATIERVAKTGAIDLWVLFPLGIGVNRLLPRSGEIPAGWRNRLNLLLGSEDWYQAFYQTETKLTLFGEQETVVKAGVEIIGKYFVDRLKSVFPGVAPDPKVLMNSMNCPLYLFCFAVSSSNPRARAHRLGHCEPYP